MDCSRRRVIAHGSADLVHPRPKRLPPCAPSDEIRQLVAGAFTRPDVELQKRVRDGLVEGHVQGLEDLRGTRRASVSLCAVRRAREGTGPDHDDLGVAYDGVRQREGQDDLHFGRGDVAVCGDVVHRVEQPEVAIRGLASRAGS